MRPGGQARKEPNEDRLYALLDELDRLEDLVEEMDDLGVSSRDEIERRMRELNAQVDQLTDE